MHVVHNSACISANIYTESNISVIRCSQPMSSACLYIQQALGNLVNHHVKFSFQVKGKFDSSLGSLNSNKDTPDSLQPEKVPHEETEPVHERETALSRRWCDIANDRCFCISLRLATETHLCFAVLYVDSGMWQHSTLPSQGYLGLYHSGFPVIPWPSYKPLSKTIPTEIYANQSASFSKMT